MKICLKPNCGCSNPLNAIYCSKCGCEFQNVSVDRVTTDNSKILEFESDSGDTWRWIVTIIVIIVAITIAVGSGGIGTPIALGIAYGIRSIWKKN